MAASEQFSTAAQLLVALAQEEARLFRHNYLGTEHLFLGVVDLGEGGGYRELISSGVGREKLWQAIDLLVGRGDQSSSGTRTLTPRAKTVLTEAVATAAAANRLVEPDDIMAHLFRDQSSVAARALQMVTEVSAPVGNPPSATTSPLCPVCRQPLEPGVNETLLPVMTYSRAHEYNAIVFSCPKCETALGIFPQTA